MGTWKETATKGLPMTNEKYLTTIEVADLLGLTGQDHVRSQTIRKYIAQGLLKAEKSPAGYKQPPHWQIDPESVKNLMKLRESGDSHFKPGPPPADIKIVHNVEYADGSKLVVHVRVFGSDGSGGEDMATEAYYHYLFDTLTEMSNSERTINPESA